MVGRASQSAPNGSAVLGGRARRAGRGRCRRAAARGAALAAVALLAGGCSARRPAPGPPARDLTAGFPVSLTDAQGYLVRVEARPERIVSTAPTATEILFAIGAGDRVVAVTDQCNFPPEAARLPHVGGWFTPSAERALGANPDLVIGSRGNPREFLDHLRRSGCPVFTIDPKTLEDIYAAIRDIGAITGAAEGAQRVIEEMKARLAAVEEKVGDVPEQGRPTAFLFLQLSPVWTAGSKTFQDDAIRAAGGRNVAATKEGFAPFSTESLMAADPDFLLLSTMDGDPERMKRELLANPALKRLSAAREGRIVVLEADPIMRPGPRIVEAVEALARAFYPDRLGSPAASSSSLTSER